MTKENARDFLPLVQALAEGKTLQVKWWPLSPTNGTTTCTSLQWVKTDKLDTTKDPANFRIKPEPQTRLMTRDEVLRFVTTTPGLVV